METNVMAIANPNRPSGLGLAMGRYDFDAYDSGRSGSLGEFMIVERSAA